MLEFLVINNMYYEKEALVYKTSKIGTIFSLGILGKVTLRKLTERCRVRDKSLEEHCMQLSQCI